MAIPDISRHIRRNLNYYLAIVLLLVFFASTTANAQSDYLNEPVLNCSSMEDNYIGNAQRYFFVKDWVDRGLCIRRGLDYNSAENDYKCYSRLQNVLENNLNELRKAEYNGAAGALAILPTIGALLGAPTNELYRLMTMIPFGGLLALLCSFGGTILPVKIEDYESKFMRKVKANTNFARSATSLPSYLPQTAEQEIKDKIAVLIDKVLQRLGATKQQQVPRMYIIVGFTGMLLLLAAAQASMVVVELGAVLPWYCVSKWWVHLWYLMVIATAMFDNYVQLPFDRQWRLCLSDVPYDLEVHGGEPLIDGDNYVHFKTSVGQLKAIKTATLRFADSPQRHTEPINVLFIQVSVLSTEHNWFRTLIQSLSKIMSVIVFIIGTGEFATAQLISVAMASFVITCVLAAGVFARAITSWIVTGIETAEPILQYVAKTDIEAHQVIASLLAIGYENNSDDNGINGKRRQIQTEMQGHIFLEKRRITYRSPWIGRIWGVLARPYDLRKLIIKKDTFDGAVELGQVNASSTLNDASEPMFRPKLNSRVTSGTSMSTTSSFHDSPLPRSTTFGGMDSRLRDV